MEFRLVKPIFEYLSYRSYLGDFYENKKKMKASFSFQSFSKKAQLASASHLRMVIKGERSLTEETIKKFSRGLDLKSSEAKYFKHLVWYDQAEDQSVRDSHLKRIIKLKKFYIEKNISIKQEDSYYEHWFIPLVFEVCKLEGFKKVSSEITKKINLSKKQVDQALEILERISFLKQINGEFVPQRSTVISQDEIINLQIRQFNKKMVDLALDQFHVEPCLRDLRGLTIPAKSERFDEMKDTIKRFVRHFNEEFSEESGADQLYQLNTQFFKLTRDDQM
ncbi:MAG: TIGR02147 family protein [Bdellovibrionales bacterium]